MFFNLGFLKKRKKKENTARAFENIGSIDSFATNLLALC